MERTLILVAIIAAIPPTLAVLLAWRSNKNAINEIHLSLNSRLDDMINAARALSKAEGTAEGLKAGRAEYK